MSVTNAVYADLVEMALTHEARSAKLLAALQSIAKSTCCGSCQEASLVARAAIDQIVIDYQNIPSAMLTPYGKERQEVQRLHVQNEKLIEALRCYVGDRDKTAEDVLVEIGALASVRP